jgi:serine/threonine protein kinase
VRVGAFEFDLQAGELRIGDRKTRLQEQPFQILRMLVDRAGGLVTTEEIQKKLWPNDTVVEFHHSIHTAIKKLRQALGDSADDPKYVETVARRGYRLMVPVLPVVPMDRRPAKEGGAPLPPEPGASTPTGKRVSHYRVLEVLGGGGMGVVYKAEDLRLGRRVALKFLPEEIVSDPKALERFEREARAASVLDHPNICAIHEFGQHEGQPFIVMPLLEGQTLRDRILERAAPFTTQELLHLAGQIAEGLIAAHEKGIVHRDIKPANIFITNRNEAKILDFGLAQLTDAGDRDGLPYQATQAAVVRDLSLSITGVALGTAPYMSPEQVRGEKLDARTDLFSLGLVIYEMATGRRAFHGDTVAELQEAILNLLPVPPRELNPGLPATLEEIINKALEKNREVRYQTAAALRADLNRQADGHTSPFAEAPTAPTGYLNWKFRYRFVTVLGLLALGLPWLWFKTRSFPARRMLKERQLTHNPPENRALGNALSPDGKHLLYADTKGLHLSLIDSGEIHDIPLPVELQTQLWDVAWFPDGEKLLITTQSKTEGQVIWLTSIFGGAPRKLRSFARSAVVSPQGTSIAFIGGQSNEIWVMGANGEDPRKLFSSENERCVGLAWSPTGQRLAFIRPKSTGSDFGGSIETVALEGETPHSVFSDPRLASMVTIANRLLWVRDGRLIFAKSEQFGTSDANLWEIMTDPQTGRVSGQPAKLTNWYGVFPALASMSRDASRLAVTKTHSINDVYVGELKESGTRLDVPKRLTVSDSKDYSDAWTRDGNAVLLESDRAGRFQIFKQQLAKDAAEPLIWGPDDEQGASLSSDGAWILYWATANGGASPATSRQLMRSSLSGGSPEQVLVAPIEATPNFDCPTRPDGVCVFSRQEQGRLIFYTLDPLRGLGKEVARIQGATRQIPWSISPEGNRIAVAIADGLCIIDLRKGTERNLKLPELYIWSLSWTADGNALFAAVSQSAQYRIVRIELDGKTRVLLNRGRNQWLAFPKPSPDGRHLAFSQLTFETNVWLVDNF